MAKTFILRCRKCWADEDIEVKGYPEPMPACEKCTTILYHHATRHGKWTPKKRFTSGCQDLIFAGRT